MANAVRGRCDNVDTRANRSANRSATGGGAACHHAVHSRAVFDRSRCIHSNVSTCCAIWTTPCAPDPSNLQEAHTHSEGRRRAATHGDAERSNRSHTEREPLLATIVTHDARRGRVRGCGWHGCHERGRPSAAASKAADRPGKRKQRRHDETASPCLLPGVTGRLPLSAVCRPLLADSHVGLAARRPGEGGSGLPGVRQRTQSPSCRCDNAHQECRRWLKARLALGRAGRRCCCPQRTPPGHRRCQPVRTSFPPPPPPEASLRCRTDSPNESSTSAAGFDIRMEYPCRRRGSSEGEVNEGPVARLISRGSGTARTPQTRRQGAA